MTERQMIEKFRSGLTVKQIIKQACNAERTAAKDVRMTNREIAEWVESVLFEECSRMAKEEKKNAAG